MVLVALSMVAIIAMAALSIDAITLYLAREEAQRTADAAALAAARVIALSGMTGDPSDSVDSWQAICGGSSGGAAAQVAKAVAAQSGVGGAGGSVTVTYYVPNGSANADCSAFTKGGAFSVNPIVSVKITRSNLATFFSRIWRSAGSSVAATATAEVFNPSNSINAGYSTIIPVQPRCVKPLIVPNADPLNPTTCTGAAGNLCRPFVDPNDGHITNPGISLNGGNSRGVIGERFLLIPDCRHRTTGYCELRTGSTGYWANYSSGGSIGSFPSNNLVYLPGQTSNSSVAVPSGVSGTYEDAIAGCDQTTVYQCGVSASSANPQNMVDLGQYPANDTTDGLMALIHEGNANPNGGQPTGQDYMNSSSPYLGSPPLYPFAMFSGSSNPLGSGLSVTSSNSVISVPIFDNANNTIANNRGTSPITVMGFLQLFVNGVDQYGNVDVTVLNVVGCSNGGGQPVGTAVTGTTPVPVRLITPP